MKLFILILFLSGQIFSQITFDTIIDQGIYKSYFNTRIKQPVAVTYTLYQGGGKFGRDKARFKSDKFTLSDRNYTKSGYDRGHLAPAEDFAYSDSLEELTF